MNPAIRPADADSRSLLQQACDLSTILAMLALLLKDDPAQRREDAQSESEARSAMTGQLAQAAKDLRAQIASDISIETFVPILLDDLSLAERAARRAEYVTERRLARMVSLVLSYAPLVAHDPLRTIIRKAPAKRRKLQAILRSYGPAAPQSANTSRATASSGQQHVLHGPSR